MPWRLELRTPAGAFKKHVTLSDPVESLDRFTVGGDGDCKEASFKALAFPLDIRPRDIVTLEKETSGGTWTALFAGVATKPGARRSPDTSDFKLVGLKKRLYESVVHAKRTAGGDVADVVRRLVQAYLPGGVDYTSATVRDLGVQTGERLHNLETLGEAFDALAALCPSFTVAPGSTYTYQNQIYEPGEFIPGVTWGVDRRGVFFFRRPLGTLALDENEPGTLIEWHEPDAEEVVSAVTVNVFSQANPSGLELSVSTLEKTEPRRTVRAFMPSVAASTYEAPEHAEYGAGKVVLRPDGVDLFKAVGTANFGANFAENIGNATDGDPDTYAQSDSPNGSRFLQRLSEPIHALRVTYELSSGEANMSIDQLEYPSEVIDITARALLRLPNTTEKRLVVIYVPAEAGLEPDEFLATVECANLDQKADFKLYSFEALRVDDALAQEYAKSHVKLPAEDPATVTRQGDLLLSEPLAELTLATGEVITRRVATLDYSLTRKEGMRTAVKLEQPSAADLLAQATLIRKRVEAGVLEAVRYR